MSNVFVWNARFVLDKIFVDFNVQIGFCSEKIDTPNLLSLNNGIVIPSTGTTPTLLE
jgi:hypothetical protein